MTGVQTCALPISLLFLSLFITISAAYLSKLNVEEIDKKEFTLVCNKIDHKISDRLHAHAQLLRSGSAFFAASDTVTRKEWKEFNEHTRIENNLPGIQGIGFSLIVDNKELDQHI